MLHFSQFFPIIFARWKIFSFPAMFISKWSNFCYSLQIIFISTQFHATVTVYSNNFLSSIFMGFVVFLLFFIHSGESLYDPPRFCDIYNTINKHN